MCTESTFANSLLLHSIQRPITKEVFFKQNCVNRIEDTATYLVMKIVKSHVFFSTQMKRTKCVYYFVFPFLSVLLLLLFSLFFGCSRSIKNYCIIFLFLNYWNVSAFSICIWYISVSIDICPRNWMALSSSVISTTTNCPLNSCHARFLIKLEFLQWHNVAFYSFSNC